jgi:xanthine dehydrogenase small subunit
MPENALLFYVNGRRVTIAHPDPTTLLVDWLRDDAIGLTGTKLSCGEGGCGACTVMLSRWDGARQRVEDTAINACLRPLVSIDGAMITTTEGIGSTRETLDPVQFRIAAFNGSQCGYCTPGFVMNMFTFLRTHPKPTQQEIEDLFDGHICRCTGFRPILEGMRSFAVDFKKADKYHTNHPCRPGIPVEQHAPGSPPALAFPEELKTYRPAAGEWSSRGYTWFHPTTLADAQRLKAAHGGNSPDLKLVAGNTSVGIFKAPAYDPHVLIDVARLDELLGFRTDDAGVHVGAAESLSNVVHELDRLIATNPAWATKGFAAFRTHLLDVANLQVRNIGSIGGNVMMTRAHAETPQPFPSDVYLVLATLGASITIASQAFDGGDRTYPIMDLPAPADLPPDAIARSIHLPYSNDSEQIETFKVSYREQDSHAIVNAGFRVSFEKDGTVRAATLFFNGLANLPSRMTKTEALLAGARWDDATLRHALDQIAEEVAAVIRPLPGTNFLPTGYREALTESLFYKYFLHVVLQLCPGEVQPVNRSAGEPYVRPLSGATQDISVYPSEAPLGEPILKSTAFIQASGEQKYTQDLPLPPHGYEAAYVLSTRAKAKFRFRGSVKDVERVVAERFPGFIALVTVDDIPGKTQVGLGADDPIFALDGQVVSWGQPIALVVAADQWTAQRAATFIQDEMIEYDDEPPCSRSSRRSRCPVARGSSRTSPRSATCTSPSSAAKAATPGGSVIPGRR